MSLNIFLKPKSLAGLLVGLVFLGGSYSFDSPGKAVAGDSPFTLPNDFESHFKEAEKKSDSSKLPVKSSQNDPTGSFVSSQINQNSQENDSISEEDSQVQSIETTISNQKKQDTSEANIETSQRKEPTPSSDETKEDPKEQAAKLMVKGITLAKNQQFQEAEISFAQAAQLTPDNAKIWNNLGLIRRKQGKMDQAVTAYRKAIENAPSYALSYKNLAVALEKQKDYKNAAQAYLKYAELSSFAKDAKAAKARANWLLKK